MSYTENKTLANFSAEMATAVETASASIVAIDARPRFATSGVVWRENGVIVSTNHTIERDEEIQIHLGDGTKHAATVVGRDAGTDLAVLKITDENAAQNLKPATIGDANDLKVGNIIFAVGRTNVNQSATASFGIINAVGGKWQTWRGDEIERFISLDTRIYLGFSGGALVGANGEIYGINTSAFGRGTALTIPAETVNRVVEQILTVGRVTKPYLGIGTQTVLIGETLRQKLNLEQQSGLIMLSVEPNAAADKAGIIIGDVLLKLENELTVDTDDVQKILGSKRSGQTVKAQILRGGEIKEVEITLGERPARDENARFERRGGWKKRGWRR